MARDKDSQKVGANWLRKGIVAFVALAFVVFAVIIFGAVRRGDGGAISSGVSPTVVNIVLGAVAGCGAVVFLYQLISIFVNKIVLKPAGIEIVKFPKRAYIPKEDVIRIDGVRERVVGAPAQGRSVFKIIANSKTYEVDSHEFLGLNKKIQQWMLNNMS